MEKWLIDPKSKYDFREILRQCVEQLVPHIPDYPTDDKYDFGQIEVHAMDQKFMDSIWENSSKIKYHGKT